MKHRISLAVLLVSLAWSGARAHDARCDGAPYGVPPEKYLALTNIITNLFGHPNLKLIAGICNMKYNGADRTTLYQLGFTDQQIDDTDTGQLVVDFLKALKKVVDKTPN